jgi:hypothetical protein
MSLRRRLRPRTTANGERTTGAPAGWAVSDHSVALAWPRRRQGYDIVASTQGAPVVIGIDGRQPRLVDGHQRVDIRQATPSR